MDDTALADVVAAVGHRLHAAGVPVTPERSGRFATALALGRAATVDEVYWAGRVTLLSGHDQIATYDAVFAAVFRGIVDAADWRGQAPSALAHPDRPHPAPRARRRRPRRGRRAAAWRRRRPRRPHPPTTTRARPAEAPTSWPRPAPTSVLVPPTSPTSRPTSSPSSAGASPRDRGRPRGGRRAARSATRAGRVLDLRASLRRARATGGDPVRRAYRHRRRRPRRLVLLADVSGSMAPYARAYLHLLHGAVRGARAEAFVFATRLTRLTRALAAAPPDVALARATEAAPDWSGGTRIGAALAAFLDDHGRRGMARGAVVVIVSDGWDTGDPAEVGEQMARLARLAHRIVWVNPRSAAPGYAPLVAGMAAALPHVDALVSGHSVAALDEVFAAVAAEDE